MATKKPAEKEKSAELPLAAPASVPVPAPIVFTQLPVSSPLLAALRSLLKATPKDLATLPWSSHDYEHYLACRAEVEKLLSQEK